jgi:hypothetical protein
MKRRTRKEYGRAGGRFRVFGVRGVLQVHRLVKLVAEVLLVELKLSNLVVDHVWRPGFRLPRPYNKRVEMMRAKERKYTEH